MFLRNTLTGLLSIRRFNLRWTSKRILSPSSPTLPSLLPFPRLSLLAAFRLQPVFFFTLTTAKETIYRLPTGTYKQTRYQNGTRTDVTVFEGPEGLNGNWLLGKSLLGKWDLGYGTGDHKQINNKTGTVIWKIGTI